MSEDQTNNFQIDKVHLNRVGNILLYIANRIPHLYITKSIKLLYILDEESVKRNGVPITWQGYLVAKHGPLPFNVFSDLRYKGCAQLGNWVTVSEENEGRMARVLPNGKFDDGEFLDAELELLDEVIDTYKDWTAKELVDHLHKNGSLWHQIYEREDLRKKFDDEGLSDVSPFSVDFESLIQDDSQKVLLYQETKESLAFQEGLM